MKKCPKCNNEYPDSQGFCSLCGSALEIANSSFQVINRSGGKDHSNWFGVVFGIIGFFIAWEFSMLLGIALNFAGLNYAHSSHNGALKWIGYIINSASILIIFPIFISA